MDIADSIADGRWYSQQEKMKRAQSIMGGEDRLCELFYIIEVVFFKCNIIVNIIVNIII